LGTYVNYNIALVPGTTLPVTINNVNNGTSNTGPCVNCEHYVNNTGGATIRFDGMTRVLTSMLVVIPCQQYHIKLAIADAVDWIYDSGVFLEANSFSSTGLSSNLGFSNSSSYFGAAVEACNDAQLTFTLDEPKSQDYYIVRQQTFGDAILDVDYGLLPASDTLWIPAGELDVTLNLFPYSDELIEGDEEANFIFEFMTGCDPTADTTSIIILDNSTTITSFGLQSEFCESDNPYPLIGVPAGGIFSGPGVVGDTFYPNLANSGMNEITYTSYYIDVTMWGTDTLCMNDVMNEVWVYANPVASAGADAIIPEGQVFIPESSASDFNIVEWSTSGTGTFDDINSVTPTYTPSVGDVSAGSVTLSIFAEAQSPCAEDTTDHVLLTIVSGTTALAGDDDAICEGMIYQLYGSALFYSYLEWTSSGDGTFSDPGILDPEYTPGANDIANAGVSLTLTAYGSSVHSDDIYLAIGPKPVVDLGPDIIIPHGIWIDLTSNIIGGSGDFIYIWQPANMLVNPTNPNPSTKKIYDSMTFTLFVTDVETGCESEVASVDVIIDGDPLGAVPYAEPAVSCAGQNVQLFANPLGGYGIYSNYLWTADPGGQSYGFENPVVGINEPTIFTLEFSDGFNDFITTLFVDLLPDPVIDLGPAVQQYCLYEQITLDAGNPGASFEWSTGDTTQQIIISTTGLAYDEQYLTVDVVNAEGCTSSSAVTVIFDFDACVGIDETAIAQHFRIYPNPSNGYFNIEVEGLDGETEITVLNINGIEIYQETVFLNKESFLHELNLSSFSKGMYYIRFVNTQFMHAEKILIR
jgi:hypothetical protein